MELTENFIKFLHDQSAYGKIQVDTLIHELKKKNCYGSQPKTEIGGFEVIPTDNVDKPWETDNVEYFALRCTLDQADHYLSCSIGIKDGNDLYLVEDSYDETERPMLLVRRM